MLMYGYGELRCDGFGRLEGHREGRWSVVWVLIGLTAAVVMGMTYVDHVP